MKKRVFCFALAFVLLLCVSAQADNGMSFYRHMQYGMLSSYENMVYHYSIKVYNRFVMMPDEFLEQFWAHNEENHDETADEIYDLRIWSSQDSRYQFEIQVKKPTYDSFETEIAKAPEYLDLVKDGYPEESNVRMLHEGKLRSTAAGEMLETAIAYDVTDENGHTYTIIFVYYDIYKNGVEYCFSLYAYDGDYEAAQLMLDEMCQTVEFTVVGMLA